MIEPPHRKPPRRLIRRWVNGYGWRTYSVLQSRLKPRPVPIGWTRSDFLLARGAWFNDQRARGVLLKVIAEKADCSHTLVIQQSRQYARTMRNLASRHLRALQSILED